MTLISCEWSIELRLRESICIGDYFALKLALDT